LIDHTKSKKQFQDTQKQSTKDTKYEDEQPTEPFFQGYQKNGQVLDHLQADSKLTPTKKTKQKQR